MTLKKRKNCPNSIDKVLFHGTSYNAITNILPDMFYSSFYSAHGEGVYFNEDLDSCWIYGSEVMNENPDPVTGRRNLKIPEVVDYFSFLL